MDSIIAIMELIDTLEDINATITVKNATDNGATLPKTPCGLYLSDGVNWLPFVILGVLIIIALSCCCYGLVFQVPVHVRSRWSDEVGEDGMDEETGELGSDF